MPVITRSTTTGPVKKVIGVKRKFIEIVDSDDDITTVDTSSDSDSEYEPDLADGFEDAIEDLKDEIKESEQSNDALINLLIKEREANRALREDSDVVIAALHQELDQTKEKYETLVTRLKEAQKTSWTEVICFSTMLAVTFGGALASLYSCHQADRRMFDYE